MVGSTKDNVKPAIVDGKIQEDSDNTKKPNQMNRSSTSRPKRNAASTRPRKLSPMKKPDTNDTKPKD